MEVGEELTIDAMVVDARVVDSDGSNRAMMDGDGDLGGGNNNNSREGSNDSTNNGSNDGHDDGGTGNGRIDTAGRPRKQLLDTLFSSYCM